MFLSNNQRSSSVTPDFRLLSTSALSIRIIFASDASLTVFVNSATSFRRSSSAISPESRRATWRFPNDLPIVGEPADVYVTLERADEALAQSTYPKLLIVGSPGSLVTPAFR